MNIGALFLVLALVSFLFGAANTPRPPINWLCLGLAFIVCSWLFAGSIVPIR